MKMTMAHRRQMKTTTTMATMLATDAVVQIFSCFTKITSATTTQQKKKENKSFENMHPLEHFEQNEFSKNEHPQEHFEETKENLK